MEGERLELDSGNEEKEAGWKTKKANTAGIQKIQLVCLSTCLQKVLQRGLFCSNLRTGPKGGAAQRSFGWLDAARNSFTAVSFLAAAGLLVAPAACPKCGKAWKLHTPLTRSQPYFWCLQTSRAKRRCCNTKADLALLLPPCKEASLNASWPASASAVPLCTGGPSSAALQLAATRCVFWSTS